jgi:hypothetical protein
MGHPERIRIDDYIDQFPEDVGRVRVNHDDCSAGLDTRKRLELTRTESRTLLAFCHHCKAWGVKRDDAIRSIHDRREPSLVTRDTTGTYELPKDLVSDMNYWPIEAKVWPRTYGLTNDDLVENHIGFSPSLNRVIIPCYDEYNKLTGFQARRIFETDTKPKYLTWARKGTKLFPAMFHKWPPSNLSIAFVEDALSAIKLSYVVSNPIAILGSDLNTPALCAILDKTKSIDSIYIMLDNDNKDIKRNQLNLLSRINLLSPNTSNKILMLSKDPKELSIEELKKCLS